MFVEIGKEGNHVKRYLNKLKEGFKFSFAGFKEVIKEYAFQLELFIGIPAIIFALASRVSTLEKSILILSIFLVFLIEVINTAIEKAVDRISTARHPLSKKVKDIASFAVFLSVLNALIVWGIIYLS